MSIPLFYYIAAESARFIIGERDMPVKKTFIVVILGVFEKISVIFWRKYAKLNRTLNTLRAFAGPGLTGLLHAAGELIWYCRTVWTGWGKEHSEP